MPNCSLCSNPLPSGGGTVLFTDASGTQFSVCEPCGRLFEALREASDGMKAAKVADDILVLGGNIGNKETYDALVKYVEREVPAQSEPKDQEKGANSGRREVPGFVRIILKIFLMILGALIATLIIWGIVGGAFY